MSSVLAAVVLYNPANDVAGNIETYFSSVDKLIVVDNSEVTHDVFELLRVKFGNFEYIRNSKNEGIAKALNQAAEYGIQNGFSWMLTMDQDSKFSLGSAEKLIHVASSNYSSVGIYTPIHVNKDTVIKKFYTELKVIKKTMTSGNLVSLDAYSTCGVFEEKLFIDYVDHDYNLRLLKHKFKIIQVNHAHLIHNLGNIKSWRWGFISMKATNHNAIRRYYITRNRLYVVFKYFFFAPGFCLKELKHFFVDFFRILFFEKDKAKKFYSILIGVFDFVRGKYGKLT